MLSASYSYDTTPALVNQHSAAAATDSASNSVMINLVGPFFNQFQTVDGLQVDYGKGTDLSGTGATLPAG